MPSNDFQFLTQQEKNEVIYKAFCKLPTYDKIVIARMVRKLKAELKKKSESSGFGEISGLELFAMMGIAIIDGRLKTK